MYKINLNPSGLPLSKWWENLRQNQTKKTEFKFPDKCCLCGSEIKEDDFFYVGYDEHKIYAESCDKFHCHKWLKWKRRMRKRK